MSRAGFKIVSLSSFSIFLIHMLFSLILVYLWAPFPSCCFCVGCDRFLDLLLSLFLLHLLGPFRCRCSVNICYICGYHLHWLILSLHLLFSSIFFLFVGTPSLVSLQDLLFLLLSFASFVTFALFVIFVIVVINLWALLAFCVVNILFLFLSLFDPLFSLDL